jgi:hypothetical protein
MIEPHQLDQKDRSTLKGHRGFGDDIQLAPTKDIDRGLFCVKMPHLRM